jgi:excisionase family DNA binding protein
MKEKTLYTSESLSEEIGIPVYTIRQWAKDGKIPSSKFGRRYFFDLQQVKRCIMNNKKR